MYARSTTIRGNPANLDDGITYVRDEVLPRVQRAEGCIGMSMLVERASGRCIVATAWADEQALHGTAEEFPPLRDHLLQILGGRDADVHEWEIAILHRDHPAGDGAGAQVTWARVPPTRMKELLDAYRINLMPRLQHLPGFCSLSMLVDRRIGRTVSVTTFQTPEALAQVRKQARSFREQFARAMGAQIVDVAEMDLALAHLGVPESI